MYKMRTMPWEHQLKALDYLMVRDCGALYTDMGTGKTKVGVDLIVNKGFKTTVVVTTLKSCKVWEQEIAIHGDGEFFVLNLAKMSTLDKESIMRKTFASHQNISTGERKRLVIIVNYDSIWRKPFGEILVKSPIDCVICDESHRIKSPGSKCSLYLTRLGKKVKNRYICTGTPSSGKPLDVYAQYRFLDSSIFGTNFYSFRERYENVDAQKTAFAGYRVLKKDKPWKNLNELKRKMYSCAFYVESKLDLPEVTDKYVEFELSSKTKAVYKELNKQGAFIHNEQEVAEINNALTKSLRLQEVLSGYLKLENLKTKSNRKEIIGTERLDTLEELLEGLNGEKAVVFAKFRQDFYSIEKLCKKKGLKYGEISGKKDDYECWKNNDIDVITVHYKSGAESISLVEARYCVYYTLPHSYELYLQSRKRVHRPGQKKPVTYIHLCAEDVSKSCLSIDTKIIKALERKQDLVEYLLSEM